MPFQFLPNGTVIADTADEAISFDRGRKTRSAKPKKGAKKKSKVVTETGWAGGTSSESTSSTPHTI